MVNSGAIQNDFNEENCWEKFESKEAKWCILALFETVFWKLKLLRKCWSKEAKWYIRTLFEECGRRLLGELLNVEICSSLK